MAGVVIVLGLGIPLYAYQAVSYALGIEERGRGVDVADDRIDVAQVVVETEGIVVTGLVLVSGSEDQPAVVVAAPKISLLLLSPKLNVGLISATTSCSASSP